MIIRNKIHNSFGPTASFAGKIVFISGLILVVFTVYALGLILMGAFIGFTFSSTYIDTENKKVRYGDVLFGFIRTGKWVVLNSEMSLGIIKQDSVWKTFSRSNRSLETKENDHLIVLYRSKNKKLLPLKKIKDEKLAREELIQTGILLNLTTQTQ